MSRSTREGREPDGREPRGFRPRRRDLLTGLGVTGAGALLAGAEGCAPDGDRPRDPAPTTVAFRGRRQAGVETPQQDRLVFAAYDATVSGSPAENRAALVAMLKTWTAAAEAMTRGRPVPGANDVGAAPPADTGEAHGLPAANLTVTIGFGPSLFDDRFGLAGKRPAALADLPHLAPESLDRARTGGDLCVQACADDPQVAFHAVRNLARLGRDTVAIRWVQLGFGRASSTTTGQQTPRNLLGFKDGTRNLKNSDRDLLERWVWVGDETDQPWMRDGSYLVARRIIQRTEAWDRDYLADQQNVIGRTKESGAPLSGAREFDVPRFDGRGPDGQPQIPMNAHIRLAAHENNDGVRILRRGYNFTDGVQASGELDAGLFFVCFQKDPRTQFVRLQRRLASDGLNEYISHVGSGLFACPPGPGARGWWGDTLLG